MTPEQEQQVFMLAKKIGMVFHNESVSPTLGVCLMAVNTMKSYLEEELQINRVCTKPLCSCKVSKN